MRADPLGQPGVKIAMHGALPFVGAVADPSGSATFTIGFKDERSGILVYASMDWQGWAELIGEMTRTRDTARRGGGDEAAGQDG